MNAFTGRSLNITCPFERVKVHRAVAVILYEAARAVSLAFVAIGIFS